MYDFPTFSGVCVPTGLASLSSKVKCSSPADMFKKSIFYLLVLLPLFSCKKDDLTRPVLATLQVEITGMENGRSVEPLLVQGGLLRIGALYFEGYRESGEDYFFTREYADTLAVSFSKTEAGQILSFEMPQGIYERIRISLDVPAIADRQNSNTSPDRAQLQGGVEIWGKYIDVHGEEIPFVFLYTAVDSYEFNATATSGSQEIVISNESKRLGRLRFNPLPWMQLINPRMLQSAKLSDVDGVPTIVISESSNDHIYNLLANRIQSSTSLLFE